MQNNHLRDKVKLQAQFSNLWWGAKQDLFCLLPVLFAGSRHMDHGVAIFAVIKFILFNNKFILIAFNFRLQKIC